MSMDVLIIEDEGLLARRLKGMLEELDNRVEVRGMLSSVKDTVEWLAGHAQPDIIFMDIELADGQCFDIFQQAAIQAPVIFTTAYNEFTLKAFKVNSVDYLLKPVTKEELKRAWEKFLSLHYNRKRNVLPEEVRNLLKNIVPGSVKKNRERFLVKKGQKMIPVEVSDIAYCTIRNSVGFLVTREKQKFPVDYTLDEIEEMLDEKTFFRVNRQFILAHDIIVAVHPWFNSKLKVEIRLPVDEDIIVSRERSGPFKDWLGA